MKALSNFAAQAVARGTPLDQSVVVARFKQGLTRAGLRDQRFHDLRHACASLLLAQGVEPRTVIEALGHSQISLTMDTYSHVMPTMLRDAADKMNTIPAVPMPAAGAAGKG
jgi:site-specific recombinase XerD